MGGDSSFETVGCFGAEFGGEPWFSEERCCSFRAEGSAPAAFFGRIGTGDWWPGFAEGDGVFFAGRGDELLPFDVVAPFRPFRFGNLSGLAPDWSAGFEERGDFEGAGSAPF